MEGGVVKPYLNEENNSYGTPEQAMSRQQAGKG